jgi:hypothetical protein
MDLPYHHFGIKLIVFTDYERDLLLESYTRWYSSFRTPPKRLTFERIILDTSKLFDDIDMFEDFSIRDILRESLRKGTEALVGFTYAQSVALSFLVTRDINEYYDSQIITEALMEEAGNRYIPFDDIKQIARFSIIRRLQNLTL